MPELKTKATTASVAAFIDTIDESRRHDCKTLVKILKEATGAKPKMWGPNIIGFGSRPYANSSGKSVDWFEAGFSPRKRDLTLYLIPGAGHFPEYLAKLGPHTTGQSCLYIKRLADIDMNVLEELVAASVKRLRATS